jgi:hypothetical protein
MNWFTRTRLDWIDEMLRIYGFLRRDHLVRKFGISVPQASKDLAAFLRLHPDRMTYDLHLKCYIRKGIMDASTDAAPSVVHARRASKQGLAVVSRRGRRV